MRKLKKIIARIAKAIIPRKLYKLLVNGAIIIPAYYRSLFEEAERNFEIIRKDSNDKTLLLMRKYAHILDKGLHRKDAAPGHSKEIYLLLKDAVQKLENTEYKHDPTLKWAKTKLGAYELLQKSQFKPFEGTEPECEVSFETFKNLVESRRSNRDFKEKIISDEIIYKLREVANWASSSCNKQPIEIFATNDPEIAKECIKCCKGGTGFSDFIPSFWVFTANIRGYVWPSEIFLPHVDVCLGAQNTFLAATTFGISGTILSWAQKDDNEDRTLRKLLDIPDHCQIIICAVMGYAKSYFTTPVRKSI